MKQQILPFADADEHCGGALSKVFMGTYTNVLLLSDDNVMVTGSFPKALEVDGAFDLIAIAGNLTVAGRIQLYESRPGLWVGGATRAETLEGGDAEVYIASGTFDYFVYGYYNDGILDVGEVAVPWLINSDHDLRIGGHGGSQPKPTSIDNFGDDDEYDYGSQTIAEAFVPEVRGTGDKTNEIDIEGFYNRVAAGQPVLVADA